MRPIIVESTRHRLGLRLERLAQVAVLAGFAIEIVQIGPTAPFDYIYTINAWWYFGIGAHLQWSTLDVAMNVLFGVAVLCMAAHWADVYWHRYRHTPFLTWTSVFDRASSGTDASNHSGSATDTEAGVAQPETVVAGGYSSTGSRLTLTVRWIGEGIGHLVSITRTRAAQAVTEARLRAAARVAARSPAPHDPAAEVAAPSAERKES